MKLAEALILRADCQKRFAQLKSRLLANDPAILDRPSRFDRKYYFHLPAEPERSAYITAWHKELQAELRLSEDIAAEVVRQTEGFSFAYMKELFLSSMMQWMATTGGVSVDEIILGQAAQLREQMAART